MLLQIRSLLLMFVAICISKFLLLERGPDESVQSQRVRVSSKDQG
jgi:hypothetical protein